MSEKIFPPRKYENVFLLLAIFCAVFSGGCAIEKAKSVEDSQSEQVATEAATKNLAAETAAAASSAKNRITIEKDSPADTVRVFYKDLRAGKFREALFLTNLRPAIEGLTDAELEDLQIDFANLAKQIPADVEINGEIIADADATVTAQLPDNDTDKMDLQQIKLRRSAAAGENVWTILTLDEAAEKVARREGKDYLFNLRIETHEREVKKMFDRIAKAQMVYVAQNNGQYGDLRQLVAAGLMPEDALSADSTGYNYTVAAAADKKGYTATAEPVVYGRSGKRSFGFTVSGDKTSVLKSEDRRGQPVKINRM